MAPVFTNAAKASPFYIHISKGASKSRLAGDWRVVTEVVWSDCPYVKEGERGSSKLSMTNINGRIFPIWKANGWKLSKTEEVNFSNQSTFTWQRENEMIENNDHWQAVSVDKFEVDNYNEMHAESIVRQYLNGEYVGSYMTVSYLTKAELI